MHRWLAGLLLLSVLGPSPGCGAESTSPRSASALQRLVVTEVPVGETLDATASVHAGSPRLRYPVGSRLVLRDAAGEQAPILLSEGLVAAGGAALSYDGKTLLFTGLEREGGTYGVFEVRPDGSGRRKVVEREGDASDPAWLPEGRIVFTGVLDEDGPEGKATALFVVSRRGGSVSERITFGAGGARDPSVLPDGRVAYVAWQPAGHGLMALHPDGTGAWSMAGMRPGPADLARPRQAENGDLAFVVREGEGMSVAVVRPAASPRERVRLPVGGDVTAVEPAGDDGWLVCAGDGVVLWRGGERYRLLEAEPGFRIVHAVLLEARPRPQGHLSIVDRTIDHGELLALDARVQGRGTRVRLTALDGAFAAGLGPVELVLGVAELDAQDGSFFARVPADTPLRLEVLDDDGHVLHAGRTSFWVRPNEVRTCVGCHHDVCLAPANHRPRAVLQDPVSLLGEGEDGG